VKKTLLTGVGEGTIDNPYITENIAKVDTKGFEITLNKDNQVFYEIYPTRIDDFINVKVGRNFMDYQK